MLKPIFNVVVVGVVAVVSMILMGCSDGGGDNPVGGKTDSKIVGTWVATYDIYIGKDSTLYGDTLNNYTTRPSGDRPEITFLNNGKFETSSSKGTYTTNESTLNMVMTDIYAATDVGTPSKWYKTDEYIAIMGELGGDLGRSLATLAVRIVEIPHIYSVNGNTLTMRVEGLSINVYTKK